MSRYTRRAIIVVKTTDKDASNAVCTVASLDPAGGDHTFMVGLHPSANPNPPPSHYWCSWQVTQAQWDALFAEFGDGNGKRQSRMFDGDVWTPAAVLATLQLQRQSVAKAGN